MTHETMSRPARGAWVEIAVSLLIAPALLWSRPARGAWVEIPLFWFYYEDPDVAPRKGRVG